MAMSVAELQHAILGLPKKDYFTLLHWFADQDREAGSGDLNPDAELARNEAQRAIAEDAMRRGVLLDLSLETHGDPAWIAPAQAQASGARSKAQATAVKPKTARQLRERCKALPRDEFYALLYWFLSYDNDLWDRQMEEDAANGKWEVWARDARESAERGELFDMPT